MDQQIIQNPFNAGQNQQQAVMSQSTNSVEIEAQRAIAEVQASMMLAKRFPRNQASVCDAILTSCQRPTLAQKATYCYAKGGTSISGPSIKLAEAIAMQWGNMKYGWKNIAQHPHETEIETFAWDIETNVYVSRRFNVPHERHAKGKVKKLTDPRDIYEACANQASRRMRACILEVVPSDIVEMAVQQCETTLQQSFEINDKYIKEILDTFKLINVSREMLENFIQRRIEAITPQNALRLQQIYVSIKDGVASISDFFKSDIVETVGQNPVIKAEVKKAPQKTEVPQAENQAAPNAPQNTPVAEKNTPVSVQVDLEDYIPDHAPIKISKEYFLRKLEGATTKQEANDVIIGDEIQKFAQTNAEEYFEVLDAVSAKAQQLTQ